MVRASPWTTCRLEGLSSRKGRSTIRYWSISTATTRPACSKSLRVNTPRPGPISKTWSPGSSSAAATMRLRIRVSVRKCWPRDLRGPDLGGRVEWSPSRRRWLSSGAGRFLS